MPQLVTLPSKRSSNRIRLPNSPLHQDPPPGVTLQSRSTRRNAAVTAEPSHQAGLMTMQPNRADQQGISPMVSSSRSCLTSAHREIQEVSIQLQQLSPPQSHLVTLHRPVPPAMTSQEASFHHQNYTSQQQILPTYPQPYLVETSPLPSHRMHSSLPMSPRHAVHVPISPQHHITAVSLPYGPSDDSKFCPNGLSLPDSPIKPSGPRYTPHPFQALPNSMMIRKPEPISWIKYPVEPHHIYPGPYAAVDLPFEDVNNNSSGLLKSSKKGKLSSTWGPQKLKCLEKSRKCVRFASTWGPTHPGRSGEYATINPRKLTSRYVRPAVFRRN